MAYDKQIWDTTSYFNPTRMNHIEDGIANTAVYQISYTGTTDTNGDIAGSASALGMPDGSIVIGAYFEKGNYSNTRKVEISMFGTRGVRLYFTADGVKVANSSVTVTLVYMIRQIW